jgi:hypothetical protein
MNRNILIKMIMIISIIAGIVLIPAMATGTNPVDYILSLIATDSEEYEDFTSEVTNKFFTLTPGKKMIYESETEDGFERIEFYVTHDKKTVMGVENTVVWDRVWLDGDLIEDTYDWYSQDKYGNVWYFGEDSKEMLDGKIINHAGSWEAGVDGAKPGIIMKANPVVGDIYQQEFYKGEAEDMAEILALGESVQVPAGNYKGCLKTLDYTPLEPGVEEHKYYCEDVGGLVLEVKPDSGEKVELISNEILK